MKIFAIKDETDTEKKTLAWLIYYEQTRQFYIEIPDDGDPWETPLLLSSLLKRGEKSVNSYWSKMWVSQRIVPPDRQNLGQVLRENGLNEYDEYGLLMLAKGRCAQDNYYLEQIKEKNLPAELRSRFEQKVEDVIPLSDMKLLVFFRDGKVKKFDAFSLADTHKGALTFLANNESFNSVSVSSGGNEISWGNRLILTASFLYEKSADIPLSLNDFVSFVKNRVVNGAEASELLNCSRQNIDNLIQRDKLHPIKTSSKNKLFLKTEIEQRRQT